MRIGIVGASGLVGETALRIIAQRGSAEEVRLFASGRSAGRTMQFGNNELEIEDASVAGFEGLDVVITSVDSAIAKNLVPKILEAVPSVVDNSSVFRMDPNVPLVLFGVNDDVIDGYTGLVANSNCTAAAVLLAVAPLAKAFGLTAMITTSMQSVSGTGRKAVEELMAQTGKADGQLQALLGDGAVDVGAPSVYPHPIAFNVIPQCESFPPGADTSTEEEKMAGEARKILCLPNLTVHATAVRVPVYTGHSVAISLSFEKSVSPESARLVLGQATGLRVLDEPDKGVYPTSAQSVGIDEVLVGRIRTNPAMTNGLSIFVSSDNLRRGAALNAVEVAEKLAATANAT